MSGRVLLGKRKVFSINSMKHKNGQCRRAIKCIDLLAENTQRIGKMIADGLRPYTQLTGNLGVRQAFFPAQ